MVVVLCWGHRLVRVRKRIWKLRSLCRVLFLVKMIKHLLVRLVVHCNVCGTCAIRKLGSGRLEPCAMIGSVFIGDS